MLTNLQAEQAVLGSMLLEPSCIRKVSGIVQQDDFTAEPNRLLFETLLTMDSYSQRIDPLTVAAKMGDDPELRSFVATLLDVTPTAANVAEYAEIVAKTGRRRALRDAYQEAVDRLDEGEAEEDVTPAVELVMDRNRQRGGIDLLSPEQQVEAFMRRRERIDGGDTPMVRTGFKWLDQLLGGGFDNGDLVVMAARPSIGKSALGIAIAEYAAQFGRVLFISMEMTAEQIMTRRIAARSRVDSKILRAEAMTDKEAKAVVDAVVEIGKIPLEVTDGTGYTVGKIAAIARSRKDVRLVIIDHFSLIQTTGRHDRHEEFAQVSAALKRLAKNMGIPVLLLAQLNRENENRGKNHRPRLSDLRETGALEQDADVVMLLHREDYYSKQSEDSDEAEDEGEFQKIMPSLMEVIVAKNRNGETGTTTLSYYKKINTFRESHRKR